MAKANPFRFSTKCQDDETDLLYYGYRYYNASTGRWLSRDPIEEKGGKNPYGFLSNVGCNGYDILGMQGTMRGPKCKCSCGPDVTRAIGLAFADMRATYDRADMFTQAKACRKLGDIIAGFDSWDINDLKTFDWARDGSFNRLFCQECNVAVTYKGKCVNKDVLNWVTLGFAALLCDYDNRELFGLKLKVQGGFVLRAPYGDSTDSQKLKAIDEGYAALGGPNRFSGESDCIPNKTAVGIGTGLGKINPEHWRWEGLNY